MLSNFLSDLRGTSKPSEKVEILKNYDNADSYVRTMAQYTFDPFTLFHVKLTPKDIPEPGYKDFTDMLNDIDEALKECIDCNSNKQNRERLLPILEELDAGSQDLLIGIVNKNWKVGVSVKTILKAFPGLVKEFSVQLANSYKEEKHSDKIAGRSWSYKMDGVRCIAIRWPIGWCLYSRQGKEFQTVDHIKQELEEIYKESLRNPRLDHGISFWDGELYKHGLSFEEVQGLAMSYTKGTAEELEYHVFVEGSRDGFFNQDASKMTALIYSLGTNPYQLHDHVFAVAAGTVNSVEEMNERLEEAFELGYEGIMLRDAVVPYDFKRSDALIKVKQFEQAGEIISDAIIREVRIDDFPVIEDGKMHYESLLTRLEVEQEDGIMCGVGSGFDLEFRRTHTKDPDALIGKTIEVKHQYWGKNGRMRFPRLYRIREDL